MNRSLNINKNLIIFGIPILFISMLALLAKSSFFEIHPNRLSIGITIDLVLTIPVIYLVLIRKSSIPKTTVVPVMIVGMLIGSIILPEENQYYLELFKTCILPIVELSDQVDFFSIWKPFCVHFGSSIRAFENDIVPSAN